MMYYAIIGIDSFIRTQTDSKTYPRQHIYYHVKHCTSLTKLKCKQYKTKCIDQLARILSPVFIFIIIFNSIR